MNQGRIFRFLALTIFSAVLATPAVAQSGPLLGFVSKLGIDVDVRSGGRILQDDLLSGQIILPDSASPVGGGSTTPQIQLRGDNVQVNNPALDYIQIHCCPVKCRIEPIG